MKNKKYLPAIIVMYLNYFIHGVGCSVLGQAVIKESLAASWGCETMMITKISAALGLGRLLALPFAGPLSDKLGRKISMIIGGFSYAVYLIGIALAFNLGTNGGYVVAYVCAVIGGIANSFLDTGIYPAVSEAICEAPSIATMGIKFFISIGQMLLPFFLGVVVTTTSTGLSSYNLLFWIGGIAFAVLAVLAMFCVIPEIDEEEKNSKTETQPREKKKRGIISNFKVQHFSKEAIAMILIGFTCTGTFQLWLNCAQNYAMDVAGWADPSAMQAHYSLGTILALIVTSILTSKIKDVNFILIYPAICFVMLIAVLVAPSPIMCRIGSFVIGWAGAGGLLQIVTSVCNMLFPKIKGTVTALVMFESSLCNYTVLTAAGYMTPSQVMFMNIVLTGIGVLLGLYVNLRYRNLVGK